MITDPWYYLERARIAWAAKARAISEWADADASIRRLTDARARYSPLMNEGAIGIAAENNKTEPGSRILANFLELAA